jgi:predicted helicase
MSNLLIQNYYQQLDDLRRFGGASHETALRNPFFNLLDAYCRHQQLRLVPELAFKTSRATTVRPDGTVRDLLQQDWGYWESKDEDDNLAAEIQQKFAKGYPQSNILFEDSKTAILIRDGQEVMQVTMREVEALDKLLIAFVSYERPEVKEFRQAMAAFKEQVPKLAQELRKLIDELTAPAFVVARDKFLVLCQRSVNPELTVDNVREMMIQHLLTEEIFLTIFEESQFHRENNIAQELQQVVDTFFVGAVKRRTLENMRHYYQVIKARAAEIADYHEKQSFLKVIYEEFYKAYNPKGADRLGIVYTPQEIVRFMIESTDFLLHQHFQRVLADKQVEILDPATGTGTFISELIEYLPRHQLPYKYQEEIHCNEVAILPYYIANLNIEFTYKQKMGQYEEFRHICLVDTLDNTAALNYQGKQAPLGFSGENAARIWGQNKQVISVIIGNPPYNANQQNENDNNKNREYKEIDQRIKETYVAKSRAQKTKVYDMYARFLRWASDRVAPNGIVAFVTNNSFINAKTFDGFRQCVAEEFNEIYIIDLKGNSRISGELSKREAENVFNVRVGIAIYFLVRKEKLSGCKIFYTAVADFLEVEEKKAFLRQQKFADLPFEHITPDAKHNWINLVENDFESLLPLVSKEVKAGKGEEAVFSLFSLGVVTNRDDWVYDVDSQNLATKVKYLIAIYNQNVDKYTGKTKQEIADNIDYSIKWTRAVKNDLAKGKKYEFNPNLVVDSVYRPFVKRKLYFARELNEMQSQIPAIFPLKGDLEEQNRVITTMGDCSGKPFFVLCIKVLPDLNFVSPASGGTRCLPLYRYDQNGNRLDNITDWALQVFMDHYSSNLTGLEDLSGLKKIDIFHYVYAVLHYPIYRQKYEVNLKRDFPRIPFYSNFWQWVAWGKRLMDLHLNYEAVAKYPWVRLDQPNPKTVSLKPKLKVDPKAGHILIDDQTTLTEIPATAWAYKLGNRSALEWILDQYKEKTPKDKTIAEKFNTYRFAKYKEEVIELLQRVCTVSVETIKIVGEMAE